MRSAAALQISWRRCKVAPGHSRISRASRPQSMHRRATTSKLHVPRQGEMPPSPMARPSAVAFMRGRSMASRRSACLTSALCSGSLTGFVRHERRGGMSPSALMLSSIRRWMSRVVRLDQSAPTSSPTAPSSTNARPPTTTTSAGLRDAPYAPAFAVPGRTAASTPCCGRRRWKAQQKESGDVPWHRSLHVTCSASSLALRMPHPSGAGGCVDAEPRMRGARLHPPRAPARQVAPWNISRLCSACVRSVRHREIPMRMVDHSSCRTLTPRTIHAPRRV